MAGSTSNSSRSASLKWGKNHQGRALRPLQRSFHNVTGPAMKKRGFAEHRIITQWAEIAGPAIAAASVPLKITRGRREGRVLLIRATSAAALEIQHQIPVILDRINTFFGFGAISEIKLLQGPVSPRPSRKKSPPPPLTARNEETLSNTLSKLDDSPLKTALKALGKNVLRKNQVKPLGESSAISSYKETEE